MKSTDLMVPALAVVLSAAASPAHADVTLKYKGSATGMVGAMAGDSTQYLKGTRLRIDQTSGAGKKTSTIIDLATRQMLAIDHDAKKVEIMDMGRIAEAVNKAGVEDVQVGITPTAETRTIAGATCKVYNLKIAVPMQMAKTPITLTMSGPQCLSKDAPGSADFQAFYKAMSEKGFFLDPGQAQTQPAAAKAMADMQRQMTALGLPLATEMQMEMEGTGQMAAMMKQMTTTITTEVTSVSTAAIPDSMFVQPEGYTVTKR